MVIKASTSLTDAQMLKKLRYDNTTCRDNHIAKKMPPFS